MHIIATYNIKGGVGKTATAVNLAYLAAQDGYRTLVWDLDPQGAASFHFRIKPKVKGGIERLLKKNNDLAKSIKGTDFEELDLIPADFSYRNMDLNLHDKKKSDQQLRKLLKPLAEEYDFIFLDCAPSISLVSENVFQAVDVLLVPMIPTPLSVRSYQQLLKYFKNHPVKDIKILPFISMLDRRKQLHQETIGLFFKYKNRVLKSIIPYASQIEQTAERQAPLLSFDRHSIPAKALEKLWAEVKSYL